MRVTSNHACVTCRSCLVQLRVHARAPEGGTLCRRTFRSMVTTRDASLVTCTRCTDALARLVRRNGVGLQERPAVRGYEDVRHYGTYVALCHACEPGWARSADATRVDCPVCRQLLRDPVAIAAHAAEEQECVCWVLLTE